MSHQCSSTSTQDIFSDEKDDSICSDEYYPVFFSPAPQPKTTLTFSPVNPAVDLDQDLGTMPSGLPGLLSKSEMESLNRWISVFADS